MYCLHFGALFALASRLCFQSQITWLTFVDAMNLAVGANVQLKRIIYIRKVRQTGLCFVQWYCQDTLVYFKERVSPPAVVKPATKRRWSSAVGINVVKHFLLAYSSHNTASCTSAGSRASAMHYLIHDVHVVATSAGLSWAIYQTWRFFCWVFFIPV